MEWNQVLTIIISIVGINGSLVAGIFFVLRKDIKEVRSEIKESEERTLKVIQQTEKRLESKIDQNEVRLLGVIQQTEQRLEEKINHNHESMQGMIQQTEQRLEEKINHNHESMQGMIQQTEQRLEKKINQSHGILKDMIQQTEQRLEAKIDGVWEELEQREERMHTMMQQNEMRANRDIAASEKRQDELRIAELLPIQQQVSNHIPTQIGELKHQIDDLRDVVIPTKIGELRDILVPQIGELRMLIVDHIAKEANTDTEPPPRDTALHQPDTVQPA